MCGIFGIYNKHNITQLDIYQTNKMLKIIRHRGPDSSDIATYDQIAIGNVRLSMVDINAQYATLFNVNKRIALSFNGEIYNHVKLKNMLTGYDLKSQYNSDGEIILHLYQIYGENFIHYLDGMFAFALWDEDKKKLILGRDRFGVKPLYYAQINDRIYFSSELKSICEVNKKKLSIDHRALSNYFTYRFIPAPYSIFSEIKKLLPGQYAVIDDSGISFIDYWNYNNVAHDESVSDLRVSLEDSVCSTMRGDENLGIFLSGGLDSGLISSILSKNKHSPITAFSVGYGNLCHVDETHKAALISESLNIPHEIIEIDTGKLIETIDNVAWHLDEPLYSTVSVSTFTLSKFAKKYVKGILTGDGSDELFLSYNYLQDPAKLAVLNNVMWIDCYLEQIGWLNHNTRTLILSDEYICNKEDLDILLNNTLSPLQKIRNFELRYRLPDYHLTRIDRLTMSVGLEARLPYLRNKFSHLVLQLNSTDLLFKNNKKKYLREAFKDILPIQLMSEKKQPFTAPINYWLEKYLKRDVLRMFSDGSNCALLGLKTAGLKYIFDKFYTDGIDYSKEIWGVYILLKWLNKYKKYLKE